MRERINRHANLTTMIFFLLLKNDKQIVDHHDLSPPQARNTFSVA